MALSLRRNAVWGFFGEAAFAACHWGGFIILGRLAGPEELGRYALALAVVLPIMLFGGLQMRQLQVADAAQQHAFRDYFAVRLAGTLGAGLVILCIALFGYGWPMAAPILLVGLAKGFENLSDVHYGLAHRHQRLDLVAQSLMLRGLGGLLALVTGYYLSHDLRVGLLAMAGAWGLVWWLFDRPVTRRWREPPDPGRVWWSSLERRLRLAWLAAPLGIALMLVTLNPNVPRYFIEAMVGLGALGVFTATAQFVIAGRMLINAVCQAAFPRLADLYAAGDLVAFRRLLVRLMGLSTLPGLLGLGVTIGFGRELLSLVYGPQFADGAEVFVWIMVVGVVMYAQTPLGYGLTAMHQFKVQPVIFGLAVAVNAAGCLALVPPYGLLGATFAWAGAQVCQFVLALAVHWHRLRRPIAAATATPARPAPAVSCAARSTCGKRRPQPAVEIESQVVGPEPVLLFSFNYPPHEGGVARLCAELVSGLQRQGVGVRVLSQRRDEALSNIPPVPEQRVTIRRPWRELAAFRQLRVVGRSRTVICGLWYPEGLLAALAGIRRLVILAHGLELRPTRERWRRRPWRWLMGLVLRRARLVVANSSYTADLVRRFAPGAVVTALPLGIDHRRFCLGERGAARRHLGVPDDRRVVLTVSRIVAHKGHELVFRALACMAETARDQLLYLVAGQGPEMATLQREAEALGLGRVVRWLGYVPEADLPRLYQSADLFVLCTRETSDEPDVEGFGLAFLEAQACGLPVVGARTGGIPEAVADGRGGWLIDQKDESALAAILSRLVEEPAAFRRMGLAARQRIEDGCTLEHYVGHFIELLDSHGVPVR